METSALNSPKTLELKRKDSLLGRLEVYDLDFPWVMCLFVPTAAFEDVHPLFVEELRLMNIEDWDAWEGIYEQIEALGLCLVNTNSRNSIDKFLLHIEGDKAWLRY
ncbi:MAG: hypothetical protein HYZ49_21390 [Chloroflexi bacterium]|nr:hypothetical protein [Chloroflexota bacterium]